MELTFRAAAPAERLYIAKQSTQIEGQTGSVGHLQADMGEDGKGFFPKWTSHRESLDTEDFQQEFEEVLEALVGDEQYGGFLKSRDAMRDFCRGHQESGYDSGFAFGFRADTAQYAYLIRLHPYKGEENLFLYCYRRDWLDRHMEQAEKGIRFIGPHYKELFRIPDGGQIRILREGCAPIDRTCRYIDDCHVEVGNGWDSLFHICQFAEQMERCHNEVIPLTPPLPEKCFIMMAGQNRKGALNMELTYRTEGDYHLPNLEAPEAPKVGKYGMLRRSYLQTHRNAYYTGMLLSGRLNAHLEKIDRQATEMVEQLTARMAREQGVTEELKASDQMKWVGLMNNIRAAAEEMALTELVYTDV